MRGRKTGGGSGAAPLTFQSLQNTFKPTNVPALNQKEKDAAAAAAAHAGTSPATTPSPSTTTPAGTAGGRVSRASAHEAGMTERGPSTSYAVTTEPTAPTYGDRVSSPPPITQSSVFSIDAVNPGMAMHHANSTGGTAAAAAHGVSFSSAGAGTVTSSGEQGMGRGASPSLFPGDVGPLRPTLKRQQGLPSGTHIKRRPLSVPRRGHEGSPAAANTTAAPGAGTRENSTICSPATQSLSFGGGAADAGGEGGGGMTSGAATAALLLPKPHTGLKPLRFERRSDPSPAPSRPARATNRRRNRQLGHTAMANHTPRGGVTPYAAMAGAGAAASPLNGSLNAPLVPTEASRKVRRMPSDAVNLGTPTLGGNSPSRPSSLPRHASKNRSEGRFSDPSTPRHSQQMSNSDWALQAALAATSTSTGTGPRRQLKLEGVRHVGSGSPRLRIDSGAAMTGSGGGVGSKEYKEDALRAYLSLCDELGEAPNEAWVTTIRSALDDSANQLGVAATAGAGGDNDGEAASDVVMMGDASPQQPRTTRPVSGRHSRLGTGSISSKVDLNATTGSMKTKSKGAGKTGGKRSGSVGRVRSGNSARAGLMSSVSTMSTASYLPRRTAADVAVDQMMTYCDLHLRPYRYKMEMLRQRRLDVANALDRFLAECAASPAAAAPGATGAASLSSGLAGVGGRGDSVQHRYSQGDASSTAESSPATTPRKHSQAVEDSRRLSGSSCFGGSVAVDQLRRKAERLNENLASVQNAVTQLLLRLNECAAEVRKPLGRLVAPVTRDGSVSYTHQRDSEAGTTTSLVSPPRADSVSTSMADFTVTALSSSVPRVPQLRLPANTTVLHGGAEGSEFGSCAVASPSAVPGKYLQFLHQQECAATEQLRQLCDTVRQTLAADKLICVVDQDMLRTPLFMPSASIPPLMGPSSSTTTPAQPASLRLAPGLRPLAASGAESTGGGVAEPGTPLSPNAVPAVPPSPGVSIPTLQLRPSPQRGKKAQQLLANAGVLQPHAPLRSGLTPRQPGTPATVTATAATTTGNKTPRATGGGTTPRTKSSKSTSTTKGASSKAAAAATAAAAAAAVAGTTNVPPSDHGTQRHTPEKDRPTCGVLPSFFAVAVPGSSRVHAGDSHTSSSIVVAGADCSLTTVTTSTTATNAAGPAVNPVIVLGHHEAGGTSARSALSNASHHRTMSSSMLGPLPIPPPPLSQKKNSVSSNALGRSGLVKAPAPAQPSTPTPVSRSRSNSGTTSKRPQKRASSAGTSTRAGGTAAATTVPATSSSKAAGGRRRSHESPNNARNHVTATQLEEARNVWNALYASFGASLATPSMAVTESTGGITASTSAVHGTAAAPSHATATRSESPPPVPTTLVNRLLAAPATSLEAVEDAATPPPSRAPVVPSVVVATDAEQYDQTSPLHTRGHTHPSSSSSSTTLPTTTTTGEATITTTTTMVYADTSLEPAAEPATSGLPVLLGTSGSGSAGMNSTSGLTRRLDTENTGSVSPIALLEHTQCGPSDEALVGSPVAASAGGDTPGVSPTSRADGRGNTDAPKKAVDATKGGMAGKPMETLSPPRPSSGLGGAVAPSSPDVAAHAATVIARAWRAHQRRRTAATTRAAAIAAEQLSDEALRQCRLVSEQRVRRFLRTAVLRRRLQRAIGERRARAAAALNGGRDGVGSSGRPLPPAWAVRSPTWSESVGSSSLRARSPSGHSHDGAASAGALPSSSSVPTPPASSAITAAMSKTSAARERFNRAKEQRKSLQSEASMTGVTVAASSATSPGTAANTARTVCSTPSTVSASPIAAAATAASTSAAAASTSALASLARVHVEPLPLVASGISTSVITNYNRDMDSFEVAVLHRLLRAPQPLLYALRVAVDRYPKRPPMGHAQLKEAERGRGAEPSQSPEHANPSTSPERTEEDAAAAAAAARAHAAWQRDRLERASRAGVFHVSYSKLRPLVTYTADLCAATAIAAAGHVAATAPSPSPSSSQQPQPTSSATTKRPALTAAASQPQQRTPPTALRIPRSVRYTSYVDTNELRHEAPVTKDFARPFERWGMAHNFSRRVFCAAAIYAWKLIFSHTPHDDFKQRQLRTRADRDARTERVDQRNRMILACYCVYSEREWLREASKDLSFVGQIYNPKKAFDPNDPDFERQCRDTYDYVEDFLFQCFSTVNALEEIPSFLIGAGVYFLLNDVFQCSRDRLNATELAKCYPHLVIAEGKGGSRTMVALAEDKQRLTPYEQLIVHRYESADLLHRLAYWCLKENPWGGPGDAEADGEAESQLHSSHAPSHLQPPATGASTSSQHSADAVAGFGDDQSHTHYHHQPHSSNPSKPTHSHTASGGVGANGATARDDVASLLLSRSGLLGPNGEARLEGSVLSSHGTTPNGLGGLCPVVLTTSLSQSLKPEGTIRGDGSGNGSGAAGPLAMNASPGTVTAASPLIAQPVASMTSDDSPSLAEAHRLKLLRVPRAALRHETPHVSYTHATYLKTREDVVADLFAGWVRRQQRDDVGGDRDPEEDEVRRSGKPRPLGPEDEVVLVCPKHFLTDLSAHLTYELFGLRLDLEVCEDLDCVE